MTVHIVVEREMPVGCEETFDLIHDYDRRLEWDTLLRRAEMEGGATPDKGAVAVCTARRLLGGFSFRTRYVTFRRPTLAAITLVEPVLFFSAWSASIRHKTLPAGRSTAIYTMTFQVRPAWASRMLKPVARMMFRRETQRRLDALATFLTS